ncbi:hypothetical protein [Streptomyces pseudogriseolus]|uniref:hypothetical protein n=1 Tax=Streptomyces pseudogriseolus TaxID=36817 RepID=UPI003FA310A6
MSVLIQGSQLRTVLLGNRVEKATGTLAAETKTLFNITGGKVLITSIVGEVTTSVTVANSYKLQANPTVGATGDLVAATDIGTTDTPAGTLLGFDGIEASSIQQSPGVVPTLMRPIVVNTGTIEHVSAGTDGAITWVLTYIPLDDGATVTAA